MSFTQAPSLTMSPNFAITDPMAGNTGAGAASYGTNPAADTNPWLLLGSIIGNVGSGILNNNVLSKQNDIAQQDIASQKAYQDQINQALGKYLGTLSTDTPAKAETQSLNDYRDALDSAMPAGYGSSDANYGTRYSKGAAQEQLGRRAQAFTLAGKLAKVTAPQTMRRTESYGLNNTGNTVNKFRNFSLGQQGADKVAIDSIHASPWLQEIFGALKYL
jgi:hypothetical protein